MQTLTKREKTLLYVLLCTLILIGGTFWFVFPAFEKNGTLKEEKAALDLTLMSEKATMIDATNIEEDYKKALDELRKVRALYYPQLRVEDVDKTITNLAINHNLTPTSLTISNATDEEVISYAEYLKGQSGEEEAAATEEGEQAKAANTLRVFNITLSVEGSVLNLQSLVNDTNKMKTLKIASVNYSSEIGLNMGMTITFKLFMLNE